MGLLNRVGDIDLGVHDLEELPPLIAFWKLNNVGAKNAPVSFGLSPAVILSTLSMQNGQNPTTQ